MATKIRRSLFIGLGGTGMKSLLFLKKRFVDIYGCIPPMVGFLGIDTDNGMYNRRLRSENGQDVILGKNEQCRVTIKTPRPVYENNKAQLQWLPNGNENQLLTLVNGAGQVRTNGRFALWYNANTVIANINRKLTDITAANIANNKDFEVLDTADPEIHIISSLCGGTGCGVFINLAYTIRKHILPNWNCKLAGYGVLPSVFWAMDQNKMPLVYPNAYKAICELDWMMHSSINSKKFNMDNYNDPILVNERPFDMYTLIDNKNQWGDTYDNIDDICEMVSLMLMTTTGELATANASTLDNSIQQIIAGNMNVGNKTAWASGMGVSEIIFKSNLTRELYCRKAIQNLIGKILNLNISDPCKIADSWIDGEKIRENLGHDDIIDMLLNKNPKYPLSITDQQNAGSDVVQWIQMTTDNSSDIKQLDSRSNKLIIEKKQSLLSRVKTWLNDYGVSTAKAIVKAIGSQFEVCLDEMETERVNFREKKDVQANGYKQALDDYTSYKKPFLPFSHNELPDLEEILISSVQSYVLSYREERRRDGAIMFYKTMLQEITSYLSKFDSIKKDLKNISDLQGGRIAEINNFKGFENKVFQIDLTPKFYENVEVSNDDTAVNKFVISMNNKNGLIDLQLMDTKSIQQILLQYVISLPKSEYWGNMTVDQALEELPGKEVEYIIKNAIQRCSPLIDYNYALMGAKPAMEAQDNFYIGIFDIKKNVINKDNRVDDQVGGSSNPVYCNIGSKDSIIFYRYIGVIPPCVLTNIKMYDNMFRAKMQNGQFNCSIDSVIESRMEAEKYNLSPSNPQDDLLKMWILGFVMDIIRNENGYYQYQDMDNGAPLNDYWESLNNGTVNDRFQAYSSFSQKMQNKKFHETFKTLIDEKINNMGKKNFDTLKKDVKSSSLYFDVYSHLNLELSTLKKRGYENIMKLISKEIDFVKKHL